MPDMAERLVAALIANTAVNAIVGKRVHQSHVPEDSSKPYIWLNRRGTEDDDCLSVAVGNDPLVESFDLECWSPVLSQSQSLAAAVQNALHNVYGSWQSTTVASIFVTDQNDDYLPQGADDEQIFYSALNVEISRT